MFLVLAADKLIYIPNLASSPRTPPPLFFFLSVFLLLRSRGISWDFKIMMKTLEVMSCLFKVFIVDFESGAFIPVVHYFFFPASTILFFI